MQQIQHPTTSDSSSFGRPTNASQQPYYTDPRTLGNQQHPFLTEDPLSELVHVGRGMPVDNQPWTSYSSRSPTDLSSRTFDGYESSSTVHPYVNVPDQVFQRIQINGNHHGMFASDLGSNQVSTTTTPSLSAETSMWSTQSSGEAVSLRNSIEPQDQSMLLARRQSSSVSGTTGKESVSYHTFPKDLLKNSPK